MAKKMRVSNCIRSLRFAAGEMTQAELADSTPVLTRVAEMTGGTISVETLDKRISTRASRDLDLITIVPRDGVPDRAGLRRAAGRSVPISG